MNNSVLLRRLDEQIRFDVPLSILECRSGEKLADSLGDVEDTKGNNGEHGVMLVTNLRVIWHSHNRPRTNLSIGFNCITSITVRTAQSLMRGCPTTALYFLTLYQGIRYEFIFTNLVANSPRLFTTVQGVHRAYDTSRLYREIKLRGAIIADKELVLLPLEQIYDKVNGVWNLSSDQGQLGTFFITNVRLVWHANHSDSFNVSVPYLQMKSVRMRDSKFGIAIIVETLGTGRTQGHILGFRIDPKERLREVMKEIQNLQKVFSSTPIFGVNIRMEDKSGSLEELTVVPQDDVEIMEEETTDAFAAYYADGHKSRDGEPMFSEDIGLAIETPVGDWTLRELWEVL